VASACTASGARPVCSAAVAIVSRVAGGAPPALASISVIAALPLAASVFVTAFPTRRRCTKRRDACRGGARARGVSPTKKDL
jgi:hypothetical protein